MWNNATPIDLSPHTQTHVEKHKHRSFRSATPLEASDFSTGQLPVCQSTPE